MIEQKRHKAGRELDKLVAETFYNKEVDVTGSNYTISNKYENNRVPNYSTDLNEAIKLWMDFVSTGLWCCTEIYSDYAYVWGTKVAPGYLLAKKTEVEEHETLFWSESEFLPEAICNTVVNATVWKKEKQA